MFHRLSVRQRCALSCSVLLLTIGLPSAGAAADHGFAGMSTTDNLMVFDLEAGVSLPPAINLLPEGNYPYDATIHPAGHELWVVGAGGDGVVVIDTATGAILDRIDLTGMAEYPVDVVFSRSGDLAYVSGRDSDQVAIIDVATHSLTGATVPIAAHGSGPGKMAVNPATGMIYLVDWYDDQLHVIDPTIPDVISSDVVGSSLWDVTVDAAGTTIYLADRGTDQIHVLDATDLGLITSVAVGDDPWGLDLTPDAKLLFVANEDSHDVSVIDTPTNTVTTTIPLAGDADPRDVDISADGLAAYVPSGSIAGDDVVYVIDVAALAIVDTISMAPTSNPNVVAVAPQVGLMIFTDGFDSGDAGAWSAISP